MSTVSVSSGGALPFAHALYWWIRGVPQEKVEQAAESPSRWERMSAGERRLYVSVTSACIVVLGALVVVVIATER
jgi:hypothetical protein